MTDQSSNNECVRITVSGKILKIISRNLAFSFSDQVYCARGTVPKLHIEATSKGDEGASQYKH